MRKTNRMERGFSLLEVIMVIGIMMTLAGIAVIQSFGSLESYQANSADDTVASQLRVARQLAISQRRNVQITFNTLVTPPTISYQVWPRPGSSDAPVPVVTGVLARHTTCRQESGVGDTPMAFGTCSSSGICIGGVAGGPAFMQFTSTGQLTDSTAVNTLNRTIFIGVPNKVSTARAVTIMGSTGRVRPYTYVGGSTVWTE